MVKLRGEDLRSVEVSLPVPDEQCRVVVLAEAVRAEGDRLAALLGKQIALLRERRQALITAAVTGELEIPGVAA